MIALVLSYRNWTFKHITHDRWQIPGVTAVAGKRYHNGLTIIISSRVICQPGFQCSQGGCPGGNGIANQVKKLDFYLIAW
jgi:hypothetical protein